MTADTELQRDALEAELYRLGMNLGTPTAEALSRRAARIAELQAELAALPPSPARKTAALGSSVAITDRQLGDYVPADHADSQMGRHISGTAYDPFNLDEGDYT